MIFPRQGGVPQPKSWVIPLPHGEGTNRAEAGLSSRTSACPLATYLWLPWCTHLTPGPGCSKVWGCRHLLGAPRSTPKPRWAFEESAGGSLLNHIGFAVRSYWRWEKTAQDRWVTGFSQCLSGEREGGRNTGLKHLPASSGMVPTCCKAGWWNSEMNPTDILKQIGLVGVASEMNSPNSSRKEKQKAASVQVPPPLTGIGTCLKDGLSAFGSVV